MGLSFITLVSEGNSLLSGIISVYPYDIQWCGRFPSSLELLKDISMLLEFITCQLVFLNFYCDLVVHGWRAPPTVIFKERGYSFHFRTIDLNLEILILI